MERVERKKLSLLLPVLVLQSLRSDIYKKKKETKTSNIPAVFNIDVDGLYFILTPAVILVFIKK